MKLLFLLLLISQVGFGQNHIPSISLNDSGNQLNYNYLFQLDSVFHSVRIIGVGESTHGTSEFTLVRSQLFKYLVEHHEYSIFFLEADYNACKRVNRYIQGSNDNGKEALFEVMLWPWMTQELLDFIEWMRIYNIEHENVLEFVGCDMQLIHDDYTELTREFSDKAKYGDCMNKIPNLRFNINDSSLVQIRKKEWSQFSNNFNMRFTQEEPLMTQTVTQWFEMKTTTQNLKPNFRDSCMAINIYHYLNKYPTKKGIYFAHNAHIAKAQVKWAYNYVERKRAGKFLDEFIGLQYFAIALEFNTGRFNSLNYVDSGYVMESFKLKKRRKKSLAKIVLNGDDQIKFVFSNNISSKSKYKICYIGSVYGRSITGSKIYPYRIINTSEFDGFLIINQTSPTHLLTKKPIKN